MLIDVRLGTELLAWNWLLWHSTKTIALVAMFRQVINSAWCDLVCSLLSVTFHSSRRGTEVCVDAYTLTEGHAFILC